MLFGGGRHHDRHGLRGLRTYVEQALAPSLRRGQIVVVDNLGAHKSERARELIEERGCELLLYLPPYSPDLNPIEEAFSKIKGALGKAKPEPAKP